MERFLKGIDASPGVAIGKVFLYKEVELYIDKGEAENIEVEKERLIASRTMVLDIYKEIKINVQICYFE